MDAIVPEPQKNGEGADTHRAEQSPPSLQDLEAFRSALDAGRIGLWAWGLRAHRVTWSTNLEDFHGRDEHSLGGALSIVPEDFPAQDGVGVLAAIYRTLQSHQPCRLEYRLPGPSGRDERWFEATVTVILENGAAAQMLGMCRDITERLRVNREVRVRARQQEALARLGGRGPTQSDLQKFFNEVVATIGEILDVEMVKI